MTTTRFLVTGTALLAVGAGLLALGSWVDSAVLTIAGAASIFGVFVLREVWQWRGAGRAWLMMCAALAIVVLVAFAVESLG
jgi:hypothetical protein